MQLGYTGEARWPASHEPRASGEWCPEKQAAAEAAETRRCQAAEETRAGLRAGAHRRGEAPRQESPPPGRVWCAWVIGDATSFFLPRCAPPLGGPKPSSLLRARPCPPPPCTTASAGVVHGVVHGVVWASPEDHPPSVIAVALVEILALGPLSLPLLLAMGSFPAKVVAAPPPCGL
jgi:hypothetical protein